MSAQKKTLGVLAITMINVIAVDSLRTLPFGADYGFSLVFYYILGAIGFFLPVALVSAELATAWPNKGGIYVWVREALGPRWGFWVIWMQWLYNIIWYPLVLSFIAAVLAYLIDPALVENKSYMLAMILTLFWGMTLLNLFGMRMASWFSTATALFGTLIPMLLIIALGVYWVSQGHETQIDMDWKHFMPQQKGWQNLSFLVAILFGMMGMEMSAVHADEVKYPGRTYPRAIAYSSVIILVTLVFASLSIALVVPRESMHVVAGMNQAFHAFLLSYQLEWLHPWIIVCMVLGGLGGVAAWIIGPTKALLVAAQDGVAPRCLAKVNKHGVPVVILLLQAALLTVLSCAYVWMPTVESAYWLLTAMTAQVAFLVYISLFVAVWVLRKKYPAQPRAFKIPGGYCGLLLCCVLGLSTSIIAVVLGFVPPEKIPVGGLWHYELLLVGGLAGITLTPLLVFAWSRRRS